MLQGKTKRLFPGNNTSHGFISHYQDGIKGLDHVFILKGGPGSGKSTLMRKIAAAMTERGYDVELWQCSSDNDSLDGVMIPAISTAVLDGTPPHNMDPRYPGAVEEIIDMGRHWNTSLLRSSKKEIMRLTDDISAHFAKGYEKLAAAEEIISEKKRSAVINKDMVENAAKELAENIFSANKGGRHLFSTAVTPKGMVSLAEDISLLADRRWLLWGAEGCGKEALLEKLAAAAEKRGHYAEIYHPALEPDRIELLFFPPLNTAVLDCGEEKPEAKGENDTVIDCSAFGDAQPFTAGKAAEEQIAEATAHIAKAKELHDILERHYSRAMDFEGVDKEGAELFDRILALAADK